jgi:hypothetical protein
MTFCFALATTAISVAAADTRLGLSFNINQQSYNDGPNDFTVSVESPKYEEFIPFRMRKIRLVKGTWIATAGDYFVGKSSLELLEKKGFVDFSEASHILNESDILVKMGAKTDFCEEQLRSTIILGAPLSPHGAWVYSFNESAVKSSPAVGTYLANWPNSVPQLEKSNASSIFETEMKAAIDGGNLDGVIKAAARVTNASSASCSESGPFVQIGLTVASSPYRKDSFYIQGLASEILNMSPRETGRLIEKVA